MPLIYNSLESDHPPVQEKALEGVPKLCSALDYGTIENVLLVKVAVGGIFSGLSYPCRGGLTVGARLPDPVHQDEDSERQSKDVGMLPPDGSDSR